MADGARKPPFHFVLTSQQCQLLAAFEEAPSLGELARLVGRDVSVVSRQLQQIRTQAAVIEKRHGMWRLTGLGRELNRWTRSAATAQGSLLRNRGRLRVVAPRELAARILAPLLPQLLGTRNDITVKLLSVNDRAGERPEVGVERLLLSGEADIGFEKDRPHDPGVRFKKAFDLPLIAVAPAELMRQSGATDFRSLRGLPFLSWEPRAGSLPEAARPFAPNATMAFDDVAAAREAMLAGQGWSILPRYAVVAELRSGVLKEMSPALGSESFGLWWLRDNKAIEPWLRKALSWSQRLRRQLK